MGYKKYAKDYEIEYRDRIGRRKPEAVRIYVGPYFKFDVSPEEIKKLKITYLIAVLVAAISLLVPMCVDCAVTRAMYVQLPAAIAWIPWLLAACSVWRLWTAKEKVEREHYDMMYQRMNGSVLFIMIFGGISFICSVVFCMTNAVSVTDLFIGFWYLLFTVCGIVMFAKRGKLKMTEEENPEKPQAKNK